MDSKFLIAIMILNLHIRNCFQRTPIDKIRRIVNGEESTITEIGGFLVAVRYRGRFICGGSAISERFVVSAAHCVWNRLRAIEGLTVEGGITSLEENSERIPVSKLVVPADYNHAQTQMDVTVMKLIKPLRGNLIKYIKLCSHDFKPGDMMRVSGWGYTSFEKPEVVTIVRTVEVPVISQQACREAYKGRNKITKAMLCAGVLGEKDACLADSGGPLEFNNELCGIVSFGVGCAHDEYPGVYTDIRFVTPFIENALKNL